MTASAKTVARGFVFPEGPRWHRGELWFSDQHDGKVRAMAPDGRITFELDIPGGPSGLGWHPDGSMLIVSMHERALYRYRGNRLDRFADLSRYHRHLSNDMVVDEAGNAFVGNVGFDFYAGEERRTTTMVKVTPGGDVSLAADDLLCPNGTVITPDGKTLIVAESLANRLTAFTIGADGTLSGRHVFAELGEHVPDGICLDADGCVWAASPFANAAIRVAPGGEILDAVTTSDVRPYACVFGGPSRRTLYLCCAASDDPAETSRARTGCIQAAEPGVAGAGRP